MMKGKLFLGSCGVATVALCVILSPRLVANEWEEHSPYYEDDAWYDISEWLDANDYNPADEQFGEWDDEVYDSDSAEYDYDDDTTYGYTGTDAGDDWFYDYWEPNYWYHGDADADTYDYAYSYSDYDGDGVYDAYTAYYDWDDDGWYEDINYYSFDSDTGQSQRSGSSTASTPGQNKAEQANAEASERQSSKRQQAAGQIVNKKTVQVRGTDHVVVQIETQDGQKVIADLGSKNALQNVNIQQGARISAEGPMTEAAEKRVLLARSVTIDGQQHQLDRQPRKFSGTIVDSREVTVRGRKHTLVVLRTDAGRQRLVDLGPSKQLEELDLRKGTQISVRGVPLKINNRPLVMAHSIEAAGTSVEINRRPKQQSS